MATGWTSNDPEQGLDLTTPPGAFRMWVVGDPGGDDNPALTCLLGQTAPMPIRGYGGWVSRQREGRRAKAHFDGSETLAFSISLLLENERIVTSGGTLQKWRDLEALCGLQRHDDTPPPKVKWIANAPHHDYRGASQNIWVVESLEWGDSNFDDGRLLWAEADMVVGLHDAQQAKVKPATGLRRRTLSRGQTLRSFAQKFLGDKKRWRDVADLNRNNPRCPTTAEATAKHDVDLIVPPREG